MAQNMNGQPQVPATGSDGRQIEGGLDGARGSEDGIENGIQEVKEEQQRKRVVVVGLGMVGISFM
jgi:hypothetical protein